MHTAGYRPWPRTPSILGRGWACHAPFTQSHTRCAGSRALSLLHTVLIFPGPHAQAWPTLWNCCSERHSGDTPCTNTRVDRSGCFSTTNRCMQAGVRCWAENCSCRFPQKCQSAIETGSGNVDPASTQEHQPSPGCTWCRGHEGAGACLLGFHPNTRLAGVLLASVFFQGGCDAADPPTGLHTCRFFDCFWRPLPNDFLPSPVFCRTDPLFRSIQGSRRIPSTCAANTLTTTCAGARAILCPQGAQTESHLPSSGLGQGCFGVPPALCCPPLTAKPISVFFRDFYFISYSAPAPTSRDRALHSRQVPHEGLKVLSVYTCNPSLSTSPSYSLILAPRWDPAFPERPLGDSRHLLQAGWLPMGRTAPPDATPAPSTEAPFRGSWVFLPTAAHHMCPSLVGSP